MISYEKYLDSKAQSGAEKGFEPLFMPDYLYPHQKALTEWAVHKGRCAILADCGMGKTPISLVWAENIVRKTGGRVLLLTPLAVAAQFSDECEKFGIESARSYGGEIPSSGVVIANYERLNHFSPSDFAGVVCDESSILKNFQGSRKKEITSFLRKVDYRLLATATAAPNDYHELGTSSEALGYMGYMDMLNKFFRNTMNNSAHGRMRGEVIKWRLKGHAETPFWRWVCSWARAARKPSDLGFDNGDFGLPPLTERVHIADVKTTAEGMLFNLPAAGLHEQREERRRSIPERCAMASEMANKTSEPVLIWCHLNDEGDLLERLIPDAVQVSGKDSDDAKERKLMAFQRGEARVLITKPKIGAWGLNFQHCSSIIMFPSHSYEQYYQAIRRCWRFGQKREVFVDIVTTEGEQDVLKNLHRKSAQADEMFSNLVDQMKLGMSVPLASKFTNSQKVPSWL
jgi:hypothetical protein